MVSRFLLLTTTMSSIAYFGGLSPRVVNRSPLRIEANLQQTPCQAANEYQVNLGKAIDTLGRDYPHMLQAPPDYSIYESSVRCCSGDTCLEGMTQYMRVFDMLRAIRGNALVHDEVGARIIVRDDGTIRVRWNAKLTMRDPFAALPGMSTRDEAGRPVVHVDGVSVYALNATGFIYRHTLEDVTVTPPELMGAVDPLAYIFAWPAGGSTPPVAVARPYFRGEGPAADALTGSVKPTSGATTASEDAPVAPVAPAFEGPMQRAARERAEDAQRAQQLRELRAPAATPTKRGLGGLFARKGLPQTCESNYDCERPLVCCDLLVARVCCSSGVMVGAPQPQAQPQRIPIPVPVDNGPLP